MTPSTDTRVSAGFTPGPWVARTNAYEVWFVYGGPEAETRNGTKYQALVCGGNSHDTLTQANALLIAAAPELFEALEPFAKLGMLLDGPFAPALFRDEDAIGIGGAWSENGKPRTITFGDLRRAAALTKARAASS